MFSGIYISPAFTSTAGMIFFSLIVNYDLSIPEPASQHSASRECNSAPTHGVENSEEDEEEFDLETFLMLKSVPTVLACLVALTPGKLTADERLILAYLFNQIIAKNADNASEDWAEGTEWFVRDTWPESLKQHSLPKTPVFKWDWNNPAQRRQPKAKFVKSEFIRR